MMSNEAFIAKKGSACPKCESEEIEGVDIRFTELEMPQEMYCANCEFSYVLVYKLERFEEMEL